MENHNLIKDDLLGKMISKTSLESPSDEFVVNIMSKIPVTTVIVAAPRPFFLFVKNTWQYALVAMAVLIFIFTSDLPFLNFLPGKEYLSTTVVPYISSLFTMIKSSFGGMKGVSIPLMIVCSSGFLLLLDHLIFRKPKVQNSMIF